MKCSNWIGIWILGLIILAISPVSCLTCYCENVCPDSTQFNGTCTVSDQSFCFSAVELLYDPEASTYTEYRTWGCLGENEQGLMQCRSYKTTFHRPRNITCCRESDNCNMNLYPNLDRNKHNRPKEPDNSDHIINGAIIVVCIMIVLLVAFAFRNMTHIARLWKCKDKSSGFSRIGEVQIPNIDLSSASGSGVARLTQRTVSKSVNFVTIVGQGRYGRVVMAKYHGGNVAVKIFATTDEASWEREKDIYETPLLRHENILGYRFADITTYGGCTRMYLVTDFHYYGSLYDYLKNNVLDKSSALKMLSSAVAGLTHLHTEILGRNSKPAIAHRDIKSKNILVKANRECCLADFGLAVKYASEDDHIDFGQQSRVVGTRRYIAPEVLENSIILSIFDSLKNADMYSFALVMWEVCRRCRTRTGTEVHHPHDYQLPYFEYVPDDPSIDDMKEVVCVKNVRPLILDEWRSDPTISQVVKMMEECWDEDPNARLTALRLKKTLNRIRSETGDFPVHFV